MEFIVLIVLIVVALIFGYTFGKQSTQEQTRIDNSKLEVERQSLLREITSQKERLEDIQKTAKEKEEFIQTAKQRAENEYHNWQEVFEDKKQQKYLEFNKQTSLISEEIQSKQEELLSLQKQKAATIEAFRREQEVQDNPQFYCIPFEVDEIHDIDYLNQIRPKMRFPQVIGKVIWSSFIQKKMNNFATNILGTTDKVCGIYKITDNLTQESYVGQSTDIKTRFNDHVKCGVGATPASASNLLYAAMRRDGIENFSFELLESCNREELDTKEKYYISVYQTDTCGLNITKGNG